MTRTSRLRNRSFGSGGTKQGTVNGVVQPLTVGRTPLQTQSCADSHGRPLTDSPLTIQKVDWSGYEPINGINRYHNDPTGLYYTYGDYVSSSVPIPSRLTVTMKSDAQCASELRARTNPSRPEVAPLTLAQDLYDLPRMFKDMSNLFKKPKKDLSAKDLANLHLGASFGWLPLFDDAQKLMDVAKYIHRRMGELDRLHSSKGLRRSLNLDEQFAQASASYLIADGAGTLMNVSRERYTHARKWGTIRWKPRSSPGYNPNDAATISDIRRVVLGLTPEGLLQGAWDLVPWSWVVNWFTNAHSVVMGYSNFIPADSSNICLMTQYTTTDEHRPSNIANGISGGTGSVSFTEKTRSVNVAASLTAYLPILDGSRLSILGSLFIQRFK